MLSAQPQEDNQTGFPGQAQQLIDQLRHFRQLAKGNRSLSFHSGSRKEGERGKKREEGRMCRCKVKQLGLGKTMGKPQMNLPWSAQHNVPFIEH